MSSNPQQVEKPPVPKRGSSIASMASLVGQLKTTGVSESTNLSEVMLRMIEVLEKNTKRNPDGQIVKINVGGTQFATLRQTLEKKISRLDNPALFYTEPNLFQEILSGKETAVYDENGALFIDRNPAQFGHVLDYLRLVDTTQTIGFLKSISSSNDLIKSLFEEAHFYKLEALKDKLYSICMPPSNILTDSLTVLLFRTCKLRVQKWRLVYRASRDGFHASSFHMKCQSALTTLVLIKTTSNYVFGGCTMASWDHFKSGFKEDPNAFLFSLVNKQKKPLRINVTNSRRAIRSEPNFGPMFGDDDLVLFSPSGLFSNEQEPSCYSHLGKSYKLDESIGREIKPDTLFAGESYFKPTEVEVFEIAI